MQGHLSSTMQHSSKETSKPSRKLFTVSLEGTLNFHLGYRPEDLRWKIAPVVNGYNVQLDDFLKNPNQEVLRLKLTVPYANGCLTASVTVLLAVIHILEEETCHSKSKRWVDPILSSSQNRSNTMKCVFGSGNGKDKRVGSRFILAWNGPKPPSIRHSLLPRSVYQQVRILANLHQGAMLGSRRL